MAENAWQTAVFRPETIGSRAAPTMGASHRLPRTDRRHGTWRSTFAGLLLIGFLAAPPPASAQPELPPSPPNIVVIVTDDQRWNLFGPMPIVRRELKARGLSPA